MAWSTGTRTDWPICPSRIRSRPGSIVRSNPVVAGVLDQLALNLGSASRQSRSVEHAIATWPTTATSIGVRCDGGANTTLVDEPVYRAKAERWCRTWPQVTALPWPSS
jgi:hypothetical protein